MQFLWVSDVDEGINLSIAVVVVVVVQWCYCSGKLQECYIEAQKVLKQWLLNRQQGSEALLNSPLEGQKDLS